MIPKKAIEKAISAGWNYPKDVKVRKDKKRDGYWFEQASGGSYRGCRNIALERAFWQALEKELEWPLYSDGDGFWGFVRGEDEYAQGLSWRTKAHQFLNLILTGGDTQKFWDEILGV